MENISDIFSITSPVLLGLMAIKVLAFVSFSSKHNAKAKRTGKKLGTYRPKVSIIIPCFNEELTLENCINSLLKQSYKNFEIIVVNDGSTDHTENVAKKMVKKAPGKIKIISKTNGGKASALNLGFAKSNGEIIVSMDADSIFVDDTLKQLVLSFCDAGVVAVGGNIKVANRNNFMGKYQTIEYITGLNLQRRSFAYLNCMQVIPGAIGAFRKEALSLVGGYSSDTVTEDMDLTISLTRLGGKIDYNGCAIAFTEAPENVIDFVKQRYRWVYGGFEVLAKHKDLLFNPVYNTLGIIGFPFFMIFPWIDVLLSALFIFNVLNAVVRGSMQEFISIYVLMAVVQTILLYYSISLDKENKKIPYWVVFDNLWYNHLISFVTVKAGFNFLFGKETTWNKIARLGKNYIIQS